MRAPDEGGQMRIWLADLDGLHDDLERIERDTGLLAPSERAWKPSRSPDVQRHRRTARIALRLILLRAGASEARGDELAIGRYGKPSLPKGCPAFSVSHAGGLALFAVAHHGEIGIDMEVDRSVSLGAARREMIVAAGTALIGRQVVREEAVDTAVFLSAWTCLEALAKATGTGIGALLTRLDITAGGVTRSTTGEVAARAAAIVNETGLAVSTLELGPGRYGAVAAPHALMCAAPRVRALQIEECSNATQ